MICGAKTRAGTPCKLKAIYEKVSAITEEKSDEQTTSNWEALLYQNMLQRLNRGDIRILDEVTPKFETIALHAALQKTGGRKKDAAELLGWGRNTLTRKLKELDIS